MPRYIEKVMYLKKLKRIVIWDEGVTASLPQYALQIAICKDTDQHSRNRQNGTA